MSEAFEMHEHRLRALAAAQGKTFQQVMTPGGNPMFWVVDVPDVVMGLSETGDKTWIETRHGAMLSGNPHLYTCFSIADAEAYLSQPAEQALDED
jgi:hypothetical protein